MKQESMKKKKVEKTEPFMNDDYSRYAAPDYVDHSFEVGSESPTATPSPAVNPPYLGITGEILNPVDIRLKEKILLNLSQDESIDLIEINVLVEDSKVTLQGPVESQQFKKYIQNRVEGIKGVKKIKNEIQVVENFQKLSGANGATMKDLGIGK